MQLQDSVVFITGASRGIGAAVARDVAQRGARLGLLARSADELEATLAASGGKGAYAVADVADRDSIERAIAQLTAEIGPPDVLINNAGIGSYGAAIDVDPDEVERVLRVNFLGTVYATGAVLPGMRERRRGHVVNVASIAGRLGAPYEAAYSASKFAVVGWSEALAIELSAYGIGVSMVHPGPVDTDFFRARGHAYERTFPKPVTAGDVSKAVLHVLDHDSLERYVPRWLGFPLLVRALMPNMYRSGTKRSFRDQLSGQSG